LALTAQGKILLLHESDFDTESLVDETEWSGGKEGVIGRISSVLSGIYAVHYLGGYVSQSVLL